MEVNTMCILGAGTMGTGIAQVAAQAGIRVHLIDPFDYAIARSRKLLGKTLMAIPRRLKALSPGARHTLGCATPTGLSRRSSRTSR